LHFQPQRFLSIRRNNLFLKKTLAVIGRVIFAGETICLIEKIVLTQRRKERKETKEKGEKGEMGIRKFLISNYQFPI
jgi:hypothetical protein